MTRFPVSVRLVAAAFAATAAACDTTERAPSARATDAPPAVTLRAVSDGADGELVYALSLDRAGQLVVGSYRLTVHYDSTRMSFVRVSAPDSMLTAANDVGGRVLIAGAAASGFAGGPWLTIVFQTRGTASATSPSVELFEISDVRGNDLRPTLLAEPATRTADR